MLLTSHADNNDIHGNNLSVLAIVSMGGIGKTTLTQVVFEHKRVTSEFQLRIWVCVSDQDHKQLPLQQILEKILDSATGSKQQHGSKIELVQRQVRDVLQNKRYLLVLDDLWTEDHHQWLELKKFLLAGGSGSKVMVTTRSKETARVVGCFNPFELQGLSEENSWHLFEKIAFEKVGKKENHELEDIGRDIVKKCANVPLSIRVVGSFLYGQGREKWLEFQHHGLSMLINHDNPIVEILKFSYFQLSPPLKSCFGYCAIFPKDYVIRKETLISLWMAQGFCESLTGIQCTEDVYEECFSILLRRCFFQDVLLDEFGEIKSCKMHDLVHDMALEVARNETFCMMDHETRSLDKRILHVSYDMGCVYLKSSFSERRVRTFIGFTKSTWSGGYEIRFPFKLLIERWMYLRVLDLRCLCGQFLPEAIGSLIHLRYLDISENVGLEKLPKSIVRLYYLQTLKMKGCLSLEELPEDIGSLIHLRYLDISENDELEKLPKSIVRLHHLQTLKMKGCLNLEELPEDIGSLIHLRYLDISKNQKLEELPDSISSLHYLQTLKMNYCWNLGELPKDLSKLSKLSQLDVEGIKLMSMPTGMGKLTCLCRLSQFVVSARSGGSIQEASDMEDLKALKDLKGELKVMINEGYKYDKKGREGGYLSNKEYLSEIDIVFDVSFEGEETLLEDLQPHPNTKKLVLFGYQGVRIPLLHNTLQSLELHGLLNVKSISEIGLERLTALDKLEIKYLPSLKFDDDGDEEEGMPWRCLQHCLRELKLDDLQMVDKLPKGMQHLTSLQSLEISNMKIGGLPEWMCCLSSLGSIFMWGCDKIERMPKSMQQLTSLTSLEIRECSGTLYKRCQLVVGEDWPLIRHIPYSYITKAE